DRRGEADDPRQSEQKEYASDHGQREADRAGSSLLLRRQLPRQDRDEDDIVDTEDDLERCEREERDPHRGVGYPAHTFSREVFAGGGNGWFHTGDQARRARRVHGAT